MTEAEIQAKIDDVSVWLNALKTAAEEAVYEVSSLPGWPTAAHFAHLQKLTAIVHCEDQVHDKLANMVTDYNTEHGTTLAGGGAKNL